MAARVPLRIIEAPSSEHHQVWRTKSNPSSLKAGGQRRSTPWPRICLLIGVALGYLFRGSASRPVPTPQAAAPASAEASAGPHPQKPSLDDLKHMADKKAEPLLAKLKTDPNNSDLLNQIGTLYKATHQFQEAAGYFQKSRRCRSQERGRAHRSSFLPVLRRRRRRRP